MLKLRKILLYDLFYYLIIILVLIISLVRLTIPKKSIYQNTKISTKATITNILIDGNKLTLNVKGKEELIATYYFKTKQEKSNFIKNINLGDEILITGELSSPEKNTTKYLFNYKKYLNNKKIYHLLKITSYKKISSTKNIYFIIKQSIINYFDNNPYLNAFILGNKNYIKTEVTKSYQENGISHLFAISGMHISLISSILLKILNKFLNENKSYFITSLSLIIYLILVGISPSILRGVLFFILFSINKIYYFYIKPLNIFFLTLSITLLIDPFFIYDLGFEFSFLISFSLIYMSEYLKGNYILSLLKVSILSFYMSIPISLQNFFQINILSIIYNLLFVPLVSVVIFPFSLATAFFKFLSPIYNILIVILENISLIISNISIGKLIFLRLPLIIYIIYQILIILSLHQIKRKKYKLLIIVSIILIIHYIYPFIKNNYFLQMLDIGQGDSMILNLNKETILIDTGGKETYNNSSWQQSIKSSNIITTTTIPTLKSLGIKKINYLILTHGDFDHMGDAINLVNNFKVEKVIFNCGEYNDLEKELIKVLERKNIKHYSCIKELNIDNNKLYFLQTKEYDNENDNSNVIYTELNGYKFMFMGDSGVEKEKYILQKYNLSNIDVLKVGHHGSRTSSSQDFIDKINPKYSIISVGKNNRYGHPNKEVLDNLENSKIYRTDIDGSIMFKIKNNKLKIETCTP